MTNEERMKKGYLWLDTGESMDLQIHQRSLIYDFNHTRPDDVEKRKELLSQIFGHLGENVWIEPPLSASFGCTDTIGDRTYINSNLNLVDDLGITIGSDVLIGPNVTLINTGHPLHHELRKHGEMYSFPVVIEDGVWLGAGVTVCPGVTIGENSVIGAGSVVLHDVPPNTFAAGVPCKVIREIGEHDKEYYYHDRRVSDGPGMPESDLPGMQA